jgi:hypothetical protein
MWSLVVAPDLAVEDSGKGWLVSVGSRPLVRVEVPPGWVRHTARGETDSALGWCAPSFGHLQPTAQLLVLGKLGADRALDIDITLLAGGESTNATSGGP